VSDVQAPSGEPSLAAKIDSQKGHPLAWKAVVQRAAMAIIAGVAIYLVFPAITEVLGFDYLCLLFALRATGSHPRPSVILVAYAVAGIIGLIPVTPGGLGIVEASLTGLLLLAQVNSSQAVLATLTYRLASYWAPLFAGPIAYGVFWIRYRGHRPRDGRSE
jgi:uncharacterized protein (TIRG00374 family)